LKTIAIVLGTRPEAIKLAPVILRLRATPGLRAFVCDTGQHRDLVGDVFDDFGIAPDAQLHVMRPNQTLAELNARLLSGLDACLADAKPDLVLVQGDTTTAFVGALASFYKRTPVAHVEAGLRTHNLNSPWPEEANRKLIAQLANLHFAPTESARQNLLCEGVVESRIEVTGNPAVDALLWMRNRTTNQPTPVGIPHPFVLITAHRREHFGTRFDGVCEAIADLAALFPACGFVFTVHPNPNVRLTVERILNNPADSRLRHENVSLLPPLRYAEFVVFLDRCRLILTDSGGIQEEAPTLGKPVLVLRDATERPEAIATGTLLLVGTDRASIVSHASRLLSNDSERAAISTRANPYGDGLAAERIVARCLRFLEN
jgi:UDP-N-acetylglucosamine 2-epimerase (non-hydrolysing)